MKNKTQKFAALVSEAGNWDVVIDPYDENYSQKIKGRMEIGWYNSEEEAQTAIDEYRKQQ